MNMNKLDYLSRPAAAARLIELANGMRVAQTIYVAAELQIADFIAGGMTTSEQIARVTHTNPNALRRLLHVLCAFNILAENQGHYTLTEIGLLLRSGAAHSLRDALLFMTGPTRWHCWSGLLETVRSGINRVEANMGGHLFDFYASHPLELEMETNAMASFSSLHVGPLINCLDLHIGETIVDVGGGTGYFISAVLNAHQSARGVLFDLPEVVQHAPTIIESAGIKDRCQICSGSFFESVPAAGDVYVLKQVLHDWDDERAVEILRICQGSLGDNGRIVVIERQIPVQGDASACQDTLLVDLEMLVMTPGGRERTEREFLALFERAGLEHLRTVSTETSFVIFEAVNPLARPRRPRRGD